MLVDSKEIDAMQINVAVTEELGFGYGRIDAPSMDYTEAQERANGVKPYVKKVDEKAPTGCIDGRPVLHDLSGNPESVLGAKLPGGEPITLLTAAELDDYFLDEAPIDQHFARIVWLQEKAESPVRFHIDSDHEDVTFSALQEYRKTVNYIDDEVEALAVIAEIAQKYAKDGTGCGANDQLHGAFSNLASTPRKRTVGDLSVIESEEDVHARLEANKAIQSAVLGGAFSEATFTKHVQRATELIERDDVKNWNSMQALMIADYVLKRIDPAFDIFDRIQVLEATHAGVHGHEEDLIGLNTIEDTTVDSTAYTEATGEQLFVVDAWKPMKTIKRGLAQGPAQQLSMNQGAVGSVANTTIQLTNGSHRVAVLSR